MIRLAHVAAVITLAGVISATASATESTIYPGVGIGKVKLGMTKAEIERVLGPDGILNDREGAYTEYEWNFASWIVGFQHGRVVRVGTTLRGQRTPNRIGSGSTAEQLVKAYPHGVCGDAIQVLYLVAHKGGTQTIYNIKWSQETTNNGYTRLRMSVPRVSEVDVRTRFKPLPQFASGHECDRDWEKPRP